MENSALAPVGISAKISGKPQTRFWVPKFQKNNDLIPEDSTCGWRMNNMARKLFLPSGKACSFMVFSSDPNVLIINDYYWGAGL